MREIGDEVAKKENPNGISRIIPLEQIERPCNLTEFRFAILVKTVLRLRNSIR
jgi:hypothetical protein